MNHTVHKIVLTGGPGGGKTSVLAALSNHFEQNGYRVLIISEVATDLIMGGLSPMTCGQRRDFQEARIRLQLAKEAAFEKAARNMAAERILIICDRGIRDSLAYMDAADFSALLRTLGYDEEALLQSYRAVFHMVTAVDIGAYTLQNNSARTETPEEALRLDERIRAAWQVHPRFYRIDNCRCFEEKVARLIACIEEELADQNNVPLHEECFDVLNPDGTPSGETVTRREAHRLGVLHGASHVCIYRKREGETEILLQKRSAQKDSFPNAYDLSAAGHVESGSTFRETARKELWEELGIQADDTMLTELFTCRISTVDQFHGEIFRNEELCRVYAMHEDIGPEDLTLQADEVSGVKWFPLSYVLERIRAGDPYFCTNRDEFAMLADALLQSDA